MAPIFKRNLGSHLGKKCTKYVTGKARYAAINLIFGERVGVKYEQVAHTTTSSRSATGTVAMLNHNEDACSARNCDKIRKLSIGCVTT